MSRVLTLEELIALEKPTLSLVACWVVTDRLGNVSRGTALDVDVTVDKAGLEGTYLASKPISGTSFSANDNLAVDNLEVSVPLDEAGAMLAAIRARMFDGTRYTVFLTDWRTPHNVGIVVARGLIGNVRLSSNNIAVFELRSLKQALQQNLLELVSRSCRAALGDARCTVDLDAYTVIAAVSSVGTQRRIFTSADIDSSTSTSEVPDGWYDRGALTWLTGANEGLISEVKTHSAGGVLELLLPVPFNIQPGDTFSVHAGCNRLVETCKDKFDNLLNFRGEPDAEDLLKLLAEGLQ